MKIDNNGSHPISQARLIGTAPAEGARATGAAQAGEGVTGRDQLTLSDQARLLSKAQASLADQPEVRAEKVEPLKQAIESGAYQVPVHQLVRRLIARL